MRSRFKNWWSLKEMLAWPPQNNQPSKMMYLNSNSNQPNNLAMPPTTKKNRCASSWKCQEWRLKSRTKPGKKRKKWSDSQLKPVSRRKNSAWNYKPRSKIWTNRRLRQVNRMLIGYRLSRLLKLKPMRLLIRLHKRKQSNLRCCLPRTSRSLKQRWLRKLPLLPSLKLWECLQPSMLNNSVRKMRKWDNWLNSSESGMKRRKIHQRSQKLPWSFLNNPLLNLNASSKSRKKLLVRFVSLM